MNTFSLHVHFKRVTFVSQCMNHEGWCLGMMKRMVRVFIRPTFISTLLVILGLLFPLKITPPHNDHKENPEGKRIPVLEGDFVTCLHRTTNELVDFLGPSTHHTFLSLARIKRAIPNPQRQENTTYDWAVETE